MSSREGDSSIPPWVFGFLAAPSGTSYWGVSWILLSYLLRTQGVAGAWLPNIWSIVTSPIIDLGLSQNTCVLLFATLTALSDWAGCWFQTGNIGEGSLMGSALIWLSDREPLSVVVPASAVPTFLAALAGLRVKGAPLSDDIPTANMTWPDGLGYQYGGVRGFMITEGFIGEIGAIVLLVIARHALRRWPHLTDVPAFAAEGWAIH